MKIRPLRFLTLLMTAVLGSLAMARPAEAQQQTATLVAVADNTLFEDGQGDVSDGAGQFLFTGLTNNGDVRRALVRFDLSSIPAGSTINSASLSLTMSRANNNTGRATALHRVSASWGQGTSDGTQGGEGQGAPATTNDATWLHRFFNTQLWATQGGDFTAAASAATTVGGNGTYTWTGAGILADVQAWYANPAVNFGWCVRGVETVNASAKRFNSRENGTAAQRPILTVVYTPPAPITGACCQTGACSVLSSAACAAAGGVYQGDSTVCTPNPCPQPTGACCVGTTCTAQTAAACAASGGTYQGNNVPCTPTPCSASMTVTVPATKDNTLYQTNTGNLSNGAGIGFIVGTGGNANARRRGLVAFDLSTIPPNAIINEARLRLVLGFNGDNGARSVDVHRLLADWGEGTSNAFGNETGGANSTANDATWIHRFFNTQTWATAGGVFEGVPSASLSVGTVEQAYTWTSSSLAADVQGWIANPATNFGWLLKNNNEATQNTQRRFESRNNTIAGDRPLLTVVYTVPPATGSCCFVGGSCSVQTSAACTALGGVYSGDDTSCAPNLCPQPTGACCLTSGDCVIVTAAACTDQGGTPLGDGAPCGAVECPIILTPFVDALPMPAIAQPTSGQAGGAAHYDIRMLEFTQKLHRDLPGTRLWGYNGTYPGPTIEARSNRTVTVSWINDLRDAQGQLRSTHLLPVDECLHGPDMTGGVPVTVVHLHGAHVAPDSDGNPDDAFPPGSGDLYTYPNGQRASTMWYHDHALGLTRLNVYMGLAAFYLIRDDAEDALDLPRGEFEVPLVIQDRSFNPDGSLKYHEEFHDHFFGRFVLVNGKVWPFMNVKRGKYRFRIVNGSNSRFYALSLSNGATFQQIGSDLGLLPAPVTVSTLTMGPAERADIVVDFAGLTAGTAVTLLNSAPAPFPVGEPANDVANVMRFVVQGEAGDTDPLPESLVPVPVIDEAESAGTREFTLRSMFESTCGHDMWLINDLGWEDITDFPRVGTTEVWSFVNMSSFTHPMHVHLVSFRVLDRQPFTVIEGVPTPTGPRVPPQAGEAGWKDTVRANPFEFTRVIMRFGGFYGRYPLHCHILEHEDHEMMRQWELKCDPPAVVSEPAHASARTGGSTGFTVGYTGDAVEFQWRRNGVALADGPTPSGSVIAGARAPSLSITGIVPADRGDYTCVLTSPCGFTSTEGATLAVDCAADWNGANGLDSQDMFDFFEDFFAGVADFNGDSTADSQDYFDYLEAFFAGCS